MYTVLKHGRPLTVGMPVHSREIINESGLKYKIYANILINEYVILIKMIEKHLFENKEHCRLFKMNEIYR